jgi:hypothetical protein
MPTEGYESMTMTTAARQRLRTLPELFLQYGVPKGIAAPKTLTPSTAIELAVEMVERELRKGKRR